MNGEESRSRDALDQAVGDAWGHAVPAPPGLWLDRWLVRKMLHGLGDPPIGVVLWNGDEISTSGRAPAARLEFRDRRALYRLILDPDFQFGELFTDGRLAVRGDLVAFLETVYRAQSLHTAVGGRLRARLGRPVRNTLARARDNSRRHYDIGNDFYRLWLDDRMVYTCAYFQTPDQTLEAAQIAKMDHVCRKLRLRPGESVVEAGCGWGSLALHMAAHYGVKVRAFNISHQQILWARERAKAEDLGDRVEFVEDDYRNIAPGRARFDAFVSVGMLEHVGPRSYRELGRVIDGCLSEAGRGLIHSIGRNRPIRPDPWITARIFPGGYTPSLGEMAEIFEPRSFSVLDVENLRPHYALTLRCWLDRFRAHREQIGRMFDGRFVRMWELYLAGSVAAFTTGWMQLFQVVFARPTSNDIPLTREHLYRPGDQPARRA